MPPKQYVPGQYVNVYGGINPFEVDYDQATVIQGMLNDLDEPRDAPTPWEVEFLNSITAQFEQRHRLSEKQVATLRKIHARIG